MYEYHGCFWHQHDDPACTQYVTPDTDAARLSARRKREADAAKRDFITSLGHRYDAIWGCQWEALKKSDARVAAFIESGACVDNTDVGFGQEHRTDVPDIVRFQSAFEGHDTVDEALILDKVRTGRLFGFLLVDAHVPAELVSSFDKYPVIIKPAVLGRDSLTGNQRETAVTYDLLTTPTRTIVGADRVKDLLVTSDVVKFWLEVGVRVTRVSQVVEYAALDPMRDTVDELVELRRRGDRDESQAIIAKAAKIILNSIYGRTLMRKDKHTDLRMVNRQGLAYLMTKSRYVDAQPILDAEADPRLVFGHGPFAVEPERDEGNDVAGGVDPDQVYAVELAKRRQLADTPVHIGVHVLWTSKLYNMRFVEMLKKYLTPAKWTTTYCDTGI